MAASSVKRTLYVSRPLLNGEELRAWAATQGFESTLLPNDMHVTIAFSKAPVDWDELKPQTNRLVVGGGRRELRRFSGDGIEEYASVLVFASGELGLRWFDFKTAGASWDYPAYHPHVTISYKDAPHPGHVEPYLGPLIFGPEKWKEIVEGMGDNVPEKPLKERAMAPSPSEYASESDFMSACIAQRQDEHPDEDQDQSVAVCSSMWRDKSASAVIHKTHASESSGLEFVLSDATPDRFGDVINADGWNLENFKKNPIALFNHDPGFVVGRWENLRVIGGQLRGYLKLARKGTSARINELLSLVEQGILKTVSVGFRPIEHKPRGDKSGAGQLYLKSELVECSIVAIPANPSAMAIAKSLHVSRETMDMVFAKHGSTIKSKTIMASTPKTDTMKHRSGAMSPLTKRIEDTQNRIATLKEQLDKHLETVNDESPDDAATAVTEELTAQIEAQEKNCAALKKAEVNLARTVVQPSVAGDSTIEVRNPRPFALPAKKIRPADYLFRTAAVTAKHFLDGRHKPMINIMTEAYGEDVPTRAALDLVTRAASAPAITTVVGWADTFVQTMVADMIDSLLPVSIFPKLAALGQTYTFGQNGIISLPARTTGNLGGGFVLQGAPIPVKQGAFTAVTMTPKKMAVITTLTREMAEHSTPALEGILRQAIMEDTALAIDTVLMDNGAASATRPQGLQNVGGAALGATAGGGIAAIIGDLRTMVADLQATTSGNIRKPVWIMNAGDVLAMSLTQAAAGGDLPFRDELARGTLLGYPVIQSATGTTDTIYLMDAADFATSVGAPRFDVSDQALLHMEDTTPAAIGTAGTPNVVAAPARSLYQTDTLALRLIWPMDWAVRRANVVSWITGQSWN